MTTYGSKIKAAGLGKKQLAFEGHARAVLDVSEYQECKIRDLFNASTTQLGGKDFVKLVNIPDPKGNNIKYVVKRYDGETETSLNINNLSMREFASYFGSEVQRLIYDMNSPAKPEDIPQYILVPRFLDPCFQQIVENGSEARPLNQQEKDAIKDSLRCDDQFHEFIIGMVLNDLVSDNKTVHIPKTFFITACNHERYPNNFQYFIFVEFIEKAKSSGSVFGETKNGSPKFGGYVPTESLLIQLLHTLYLFHSVYKIAHNDLHYDNWMVKEIDDTDLDLDGKKVKDCSHLRYRLKGVDLFVPRGDYLTKIIDFGFSRKYSSPQVLQHDNPPHPVPQVFNAIFDYHLPVYHAFRTDLKFLSDFFGFVYNEGGSTSVNVLDKVRGHYSSNYGRMDFSKLPPNDVGLDIVLLEFPGFRHLRNVPPVSADKIAFMGTDEANVVGTPVSDASDEYQGLVLTPSPPRV